MHQSWGVDQGLPGPSVSTILQDPQGYLWIGTTDGLARFDGHRFVVFDRANTPSFPLDEVNVRWIDPDGTVWLGFFPVPGLVRYRDGVFTPVPEVDVRPLALARERDGVGRALSSFLIGSEKGLFRWCEGEPLQPLAIVPPLSKPAIGSLLVGAAGEVWAGPNYEPPMRLAAAAGGFVRAWQAPSPRGTSAPAFVAAGPAGGTLATTGGEVLAVASDGRFQSWHDGLLGPLSSALTDRDGAVWVGVGVAGAVQRLDGDHFGSFGPAEGLLGERVYALTEDREGDLWAGTWDGGITRLSDGPIVTFGVRQGLASKGVRSVFVDAGGRLWVGSNGGLQRREADGSWRTWTRREGLAGDWVYALADDGAGGLWVGTGEALQHLEGDRLAPREAWLPSDIVFSLDREPGGRLWVAAGASLYVREPDGAATRRLDLRTDLGVADALIFATLAGDQGHRWLATRRGLLDLPPSGPATLVDLGSDPAQTLVFSLFQGANGDLWVGVMDRGLFRRRPGSSHFDAVPGLPDSTPSGLAEDLAHNLWVGSDRGLVRLDRDEIAAFDAGHLDRFHPLLLDRRDGMTSATVHGGSGHIVTRDAGGKLWFATIAGAARLDPAAVERAVAPRPIIEAARVDGVATPLPSLAALPPGRHRLEIEITAIHLRDPEGLRFRYRLTAAGKAAAGWVDLAGRRLFELVPGPGGHQLEVSASLDGLTWSDAVTLPLAVARWPWQMPWFWVLVVGSAVGLTVAGVRRRIRGIVGREREVQRELTIQADLGRAVTGVLDPAVVVEELAAAAARRFPAAWHVAIARREGRPPAKSVTGSPPTALAAGLDAAAWEEIAAAMSAAGGELEVRLQSGGVTIGVLAAGPRQDGAPYTARDHAQAAALASQAAAALEGAWQAQEAVRWRDVSEARREWSALDPWARLVFAAVARAGPDAPLDAACLRADLGPVALGSSVSHGWRESRVDDAVASLCAEGVLTRELDGRLRIERRSWLLLPETRQSLAEMASVLAHHVGPYRLLDRLGGGGMGDVYRAVDVHSGAPAAVKLLHPHETELAEARQRLEREGELVASLDHPNVVHLLARGEHEGRLYLAMELLEGETLAARLGRGPLSEPAAITMATEIAAGLGALHARGVIHRDVKPANIMCVPDPAGEAAAERYVLLDLGLARGLGATTLTQVQAVLGTLPYLAPEGLRGQPLDARADLWSLGVVLYEALSGRLPWADAPSVQLALEILRVKEAPVFRLTAAVSPALRDLLARLLAPDPDQRIGSAAELVAALAELRG